MDNEKIEEIISKMRKNNAILQDIIHEYEPSFRANEALEKQDCEALVKEYCGTKYCTEGYGQWKSIIYNKHSEKVRFVQHRVDDNVLTKDGDLLVYRNIAKFSNLTANELKSHLYQVILSYGG